MAKRIVSITSLTPTAVADATNFVNNQYFTIIQGGSATQLINIVEFYLGGLAGANAAMIILSSFDSTVGATITAGNTVDAPLSAATAALAAPAKVGNSATTQPQRSSALHLHNLTMNAFGGELRLNYPLDQQAVLIGNTANTGEISVSMFTGGTAGAVGFHMIYEPA